MKPESHRRGGIRNRVRLVVYGVLILFLADYFLIHPARITVDRLPPPEPPLKNLVQNLRRHVTWLASARLAGRRPGTPGNRQAARYLEDRFRNIGLVPAPSGRTRQKVGDSVGDNIFSALPPVRPASRGWMVLGAHFDHLGRVEGDLYPGADDNASSVAILLETARLLREGGPLRQFNLLFAGFNSEDPPYIYTGQMGSIHFIRHSGELGIPWQSIRLAVIMDLMGGVFWKPLQDSVFAMGAEKSPPVEHLVRSLRVPGLQIRTLGIHMIEHIPRLGRRAFSDYLPFQDRRIPYLFLSSGRTPRYHRPTDTADPLHYVRMARSVQWLVKFLRAVDGLQESLPYEEKREDLLSDAREVGALVGRAADWTTKIPQTSLISQYKLKRDRGRIRRIRETLAGGGNLTAKDIAALRNASIRLQCLLGNMGPCFLIP